MKLNFKTLLKFLIPIFGLAALSGYYRYRYVLNPDGLRNSKGELYGEKYSTLLDYPNFVDKCLSFEQDNSAISYGEKKGSIFPAASKREELNFVQQKITLRGYGSLINSCRHDVVINRISMQSQIGDSGKWEGILESSFYPNESYVAEEDKDIEPINNIYYPDGNILKANSSLKIELASTDWYYEKPYSSLVGIPEKNTPIKFRLKKESRNLNFWTFSISLNTENLDKKKLAEDGLATFRIFFKNPHGNRTIILQSDECIVYIENKVLEDGCTLKKWQLFSNNKPILNSKDFGKYSIN